MLQILPRTQGVMNMTAKGGEMEIPAAHASIVQPHRQFAIFAPPSYEVLVEAVDPEEISAPQSEIARTYPSHPFIWPAEQPRKEMTTDEVFAVADSWPEKRRPEGIGAHSLGADFFIEEDSGTLHEKTGFGGRFVVGDKFWVEEDVVVDDDYVVPS